MQNYITVVVFAIIILSMAIKICQEYERGVVFRLGRLVGTRGPGIFFLWPIIERMVKVDLRTATIELPPQEVITRDNVTMKVTAVVYYRVIEPAFAITKVLDYNIASLQIAQTTVRNVLGQSMLDELLSQREEINLRLQKIIDEQTEPWGIKVSIVEIKDVELPQTMQRAMAKQAEAEREKRAKVIHADGENEASVKLLEAAKTISQNDVAIQLRYLQTLVEVSAEKNSTLIFPVPIDILKHFVDKDKGSIGPAK